MAVTDLDIREAIRKYYHGENPNEGEENHLLSVTKDMIMDAGEEDCDDAEEIGQFVAEAIDEYRIADQDASDAAEMMGEDYRVFADPGGNSALRAATPDNPRNLPCPTCKEPNRLTLKDKRLGYHCDSCADKLELGGY